MTKKTLDQLKNAFASKTTTNDSNQNKVGTETAILTVNLPPQIEK